MSSKTYKITLDTSEFIKQLKALEQQTRKLQGTLNNSFSAQNLTQFKPKVEEIADSVHGLEGAFSSLGRSIVGVFALRELSGFANSIVQVRGQFQQLEIAFNTMLGSKEKADALMAEIAQTAARTPFDLQGVAQGAKQLLAYGTASEEVNKRLIMLGDIASGVSAPLGDIVYLYGTTMTQGRLFTQDLRQFQGRGIPLAEELAKQFGVAKDKVGELVTAGKVGAEEFNKAMESLAQGKFNNLMAEQSKSLTGQISNLEDQLQGVYNELGKSSEGVISLALTGVGTLLEHYKTIGETLIALVATYGAVRTALIVEASAKAVSMRASYGLISANKLQIAVSILAKRAQDALNLSVLKNPYVIAAVALSALAYGIYKYATQASVAERAQESFNEAIKRQSEAIDENRSKSESLLQTIRDGNETNYARNQAYNALISIYPDLLGKIDLEKLKTMELTEAVRLLNTERDKATIKGKEDHLADLEDAKKYAELLMQGKYTEAQKLKRGEEVFDSGKSVFETVHTRHKEILEEIRLAKDDLHAVRTAQREASLSNEDKMYILAQKRLHAERELAKLEKQQEGYVNGGISGLPDIIQGRIIAKRKEIDSYRHQEQQYRSVVKEEAKTTKKTLEESIKSLTDAYENMSVEEIKQGKGKSILAQIQAKQKELKAYDISDKKTTSRTNISHERKVELGKIIADEKTQAKQRALDLVEQEISTMQNGYDKELAMIQLEAERRNLKLEDLSRQMVEDNKRRAKAEWLAKNPNKKESDYREQADVALTDEQQRTLEAQSKANALQNLRQQEDLNKKVLERYRTLEQKKTDISERYARERREIDLVAGISDSDRTAYIEELERSRESEIREVNNAIVEHAERSSSALVSLFSDASSKSATELRRIISTTRELLDYLNTTPSGQLEAKFGMSASTLQALKDNPEKLKAVIDELRRKMDELGNASPLEKLAQSFVQAFDVIHKARQDKRNAERVLASQSATDVERTNAQEVIDSTTSRIGRGIQNVGNVASEANKTIQNLGDSLRSAFGDSIGDAIGGIASTIGSLGGVANGIGQIMSGGPLGFISGSISIASSIGSIIGSISKIEEENARVAYESAQNRIALQQEYNDLLMKQNLLYKEGQGVLGENQYGKMVRGVEVYHDAIKKLRIAIRGTHKDKVDYFEWKSGMPFLNPFAKEQAKRADYLNDRAGLANIFIAHGTKKTGGFLGLFKRTEDTYKSVLDIYPDLLDKEGKLNVLRAEAVLQQGKFLGGAKATLENMVKLAKQAEEAEKAMSDYLTGIFGSLGSSLGDSLVDAFKRGESAGEAFRKSVSETFEKLAKDMAYNAILAEPIQKASDAMKSIYKDMSLTGSQRMAKTAEVLGSLLSNMDTLQGEYNNILAEVERAGKSRGIDVFRNNSDTRTASSKGIAQASQDSIDTLVGLSYTQVAISERTALAVEAVRDALALDRLSSVGERCLGELILIRRSNEDIERHTALMASIGRDIQTNGLHLKR